MFDVSLGIILYQGSTTKEPAIYEAWGLGKGTGKGNWHIIKGTPTNPQATVFKLELDPDTFLFLLKGDDNVLFMLDSNRNYLTGNAHFSYTLNRATN